MVGLEILCCCFGNCHIFFMKITKKKMKKNQEKVIGVPHVIYVYPYTMYTFIVCGWPIYISTCGKSFEKVSGSMFI